MKKKSVLSHERKIIRFLDQRSGRNFSGKICITVNMNNGGITKTDFDKKNDENKSSR